MRFRPPSRPPVLPALLVLVAFAPAPQRSGEPSDPAVAAALREARSSADILMNSIRTTLFRQMAGEGPVSAISVCADSAPAITAEVSAWLDVDVRRTSLKTRNPLNRPDSLEAAVLAGWEAALASAGKVDTGGVWTLRWTAGRKTVHYMRPIFLQPPCLTCHGDPETLRPDVRAALEVRYPRDRAVGYRTGQLRGAVVASAIVR